MKFFRNCLSIAVPMIVLVCALCGILFFTQDQAAFGAEDSANDWYAVRAAAFTRFDTDGKGYFELKDWPGRQRTFRLMDVNRDGRVTLEEFQSLRLRWWNQTFENMDLDGNRLITRGEWMDVDAAFDRLDRNKDGVIQRHEFYNPR